MFRSSSPTYSDTMPELNTMRSASPLHFLYPHLNLSTTQSHYSYSSSTATPRSKAAKQKSRRTPDHDDISRLLDPSYLPSSSSSAGVYVDPSGVVHDPDYRHFPLVTSPSNNGAHKHGHHHHTHNGNGHHHTHTARRHSGGTRGRTSPRPHFDWELAVDESALDDEYPPEEEEHIQNHRYGYGGYAGGMSSASSRRSGSSSNPNSPVIIRRPRDSSFSTANTTPTWYSPTVTDNTLPTSYELGDTSEEEEKEKEAVKKGEKKKPRRLSKGDKENVPLKASDEEKCTSTTGARTSFDEDSAEHFNGAIRDGEDEDEMALARHQEYVPTCGQSLRRSWQAFALRFRFGLFRAQRRMTRRVHSLL